MTSSTQLCLGTVQFGLPYGITNQAGQVPESEVRRILDLAAVLGISLFDTAQAWHGGKSPRALLANFSTASVNQQVVGRRASTGLEANFMNVWSSCRHPSFPGCSSTVPRIYLDRMVMSSWSGWRIFASRVWWIVSVFYL